MKKLAEIAIKYFFMMTLCSVDYRLNFSLRRGEIWLFLAPYPNPGFSGWEEGPLSPFDVSALAKFRQINLSNTETAEPAPVSFDFQASPLHLAGLRRGLASAPSRIYW